MSRLFLLTSLIVLLLTGCSQSVPVANVQEVKPSWILNPNENNNIGAIGVASRTHDQKISTQRKLAITRALEELSLQQGVKVQMSIQKNENIINDNMNTKLDINSSFKTSTTVTAHVASSWQDESTSELYIWMVMD